MIYLFFPPKHFKCWIVGFSSGFGWDGWPSKPFLLFYLCSGSLNEFGHFYVERRSCLLLPWVEIMWAIIRQYCRSWNCFWSGFWCLLKTWVLWKLYVCCVLCADVFIVCACMRVLFRLFEISPVTFKVCLRAVLKVSFELLHSPSPDFSHILVCRECMLPLVCKSA